MTAPPPVLDASPRRRRRRVGFVLGAALLAVVVLGVAAAAFRVADVPARISVGGRDYQRSALDPVDAVAARAGGGSWQQVGAVGLRSRPVFAGVGPGVVPVEVYVQVAPDGFQAYALLGGP